MFAKSAMGLVAIAAGVGVFTSATQRGAPATSTSCAPVMQTEVCTWVRAGGEDITELGVTIPMALIESVPLDAEMVWPPRELAAVAFPPEARERLGFDHLGLNWEAHGHPPALFATPHFDFHFYSVSQAQVSGIDCSELSKPTALPASYALPDVEVPGMGEFIGLCVPGMGMHAMPAAEVAETRPFEATMMVGYYRSQPIFVEPMVSRDVLLAKKGFTLAVPEIANTPRGVRYPHAFRAEYDDGARAYHLVFSGFGAE